jgi:CubicO group peptidase (beta-lactamase class C family)
MNARLAKTTFGHAHTREGVSVMKFINCLLTVLLLVTFLSASLGQSLTSFADSIRVKYAIPELAFAVVSSDTVYEMQALGVRQANTSFRASLADKFRIGSNTKTVTSYLATLLVKQGRLRWDTKFFDLYPELRVKSNPAYYDLTLQDFLTLRAKLIQWSYGNDTPTKEEIKGNSQQQRYEFVSWILKQPPGEPKTIYWANPSYVAAGLMLEKATGKPYEKLVKQLGNQLGIAFDFGQPNVKDHQLWGHDDSLGAEKPAINYKLNWLSSAGNINVSLPDYAKFIQLQLKGLLGRSTLLTAAEFDGMHYGLPEFAVGWKWTLDEKSHLKYSFHEGNPGTFLTKAFVYKDVNRAFILFANIQSEEAEKGLLVLLDELKKHYGR